LCFQNKNKKSAGMTRLQSKLAPPPKKRAQWQVFEEGVGMPPKQVVHNINNQLTIVIGRASMLAAESDDAAIKKRCEEIEAAAQNISRLLNRMSASD
jgi:hypothetical protein